MSQKFTSTIAGASIFISIIGLASRGLGFIREMIFAKNFGLQTEFDIYLIGAVLPVSINSVILYVGQNYFIPEYQKKIKSNSEDAQRYFQKSFIGFTLAGTILAIFLFLASDIIINSYMSSAPQESKILAIQILKIFLITVPFSAGISILSALLQAVYEFKYPAMSMLFLNITIIILLLFFSNKFGVVIIPIGYVVGTVLQFAYLIFKSRRIIKLRLFSQINEYSISKSLLSSSIILIILIESISQLYTIFDRYFYSEVSSGGIASLNYAMIIFLLPISIFSIALATAVFPKITKAISDSAPAEIEKIYNDSISMNVILFVPITFILFFWGDTVIRVLFERGKFVEESTLITYGVLRIYALSITFYSVYAVLNKIFYAINSVRLLLLITIFGLILKFALNFLLVAYEQNGLALSTSISYFFFFLMSFLILNFKLRIKNKTLFIKDLIFHFSNCMMCLVATKIISNIFEGQSIAVEISIIALFIFLYILNLSLLSHNVITLINNILKQFNLNRPVKQYFFKPH